MSRLLEIQKELTQVVGPSGYEHRRREAIVRMVRPHVDEVFTDAMGNLYAHRRGPGKKIMVAAHMDTIGFVVERIDERGFIKVFAVGGVDASRLSAYKLRFEGGVSGVFRPEQKAEMAKKAAPSVSIGDFYVDIGARSREEALQAVPIGSRVVYDVAPVLLSEHALLSSYCDDLMGCSVMIEALAETRECQNDMHYVFTVQEEVGCRGAQVAAHRLAPDIGIAVEVVGADDGLSDKPEPAHLSLGGGPVLRAFDKATIYDNQLLRRLLELSGGLGIGCQVKYTAGGSNDASAMQKAGLGAKVASLCFPTRYIHSQAELVDLRDVEGVKRLLTALASAAIGADGHDAATNW